jgi:aromatic-L-amino-acid decarboxylase
MDHPLEPDRTTMETLGRLTLDRAIDFVEGFPDRPMMPDPDVAARVTNELLAPPPDEPAPIGELLARMDRAASCAVEVAGPGYLAYVPGGGVFSSAVADLYARATNRFVGVTALAPGLAAMEHGIVRWLCDVCGLPSTAGGQLHSGGSMANLSAVITARHAGLGEDLANGTLYVSEHVHQSIAKAAYLAGLPKAAVRRVPCTADLRMDPEAAAAMIAADKTAGRRPFLLVGTAGTTNTGAIDPLPALADIASEHHLWLHMDAAYGGLFALTARGQQRLEGLERADSITLDPHKSLFMPYGTGALLVRDPAALRAAHEVGAAYLQDLDSELAVPNAADLGPELSREARGLRVWLPLHLHGVAAFRDALDEKLDLAQHAYERLSAEPALETPWEPELTIVAFRLPSEAANRRLLEQTNASRRVFMSSTRIDGRHTLRLAILSHRTHADRIEEALDLIVAAAPELRRAA